VCTGRRPSRRHREYGESCSHVLDLGPEALHVVVLEKMKEKIIRTEEETGIERQTSSHPHKHGESCMHV